MRVNIHTDEGILELKRSGRGGTLQDFLTLVQDPSIPAEAATKRYVDNLFSGLSVNSITSGTLDVAQLPALSGDVVSGAGTGVVNLTPVVSAGTYVAPVVNAKGQVTGGGQLSAAQLPELDWSVVSQGHPTDLVGYGIKDAISDAGGSISVNIKLNAAPTQPTHAATKQYADTAALSSGGGGVDIGTVMLKIVNSSVDGYLQCNGALVNKATYIDLFNVLEDAYDTRVVSGAGKPWQQQYNINASNNISFSYPSAGTTLATATGFGEVAVTKNRVYVLGGFNASNTNVIQTASIGEDGEIGAWSNAALTLPSGMKHFQVVVTRNYLYLLSGTGSGNSTNFIYRAQIDASGNLGSWQTDGNLPAGLSGHQVFVTSSRLYVIGGSVDGGVTTVKTVHHCEVKNDGSLGTWTVGPELPVAMQHTRLAVTKGRVYLLGGHTGTAVISNMFYGVIDGQGVITSWVPTGVMPNSLALGQVVVTNAYVYYAGGTVNNDLSGCTTNILRASVELDGSIGNWSLMSGACALKGGHVVSIRNRVSVLGGVNASGSYLNTTLHFTCQNAGAPNDYSFYYNNVVFSPGDATEFRLPDLSDFGNAEARYYIKY